MINTMLDNGDMKAVEFQRAINVSSKAYYAFMNQSGAYKGSGCDTYMKGWAFFKHREMQGKPLPKKKTKTAAASKSKGPKMPGSETTDGKDLSNIHLDGEQTDSVPVLDSCDEVRKKISAHLKKDTVVQAALLRDFHAQYHTDRAPKKIQGSQLDRFRNMKGAKSGNTNPIYYSAYCFFEKLRIAEGKPKSNHRQQMEQIYGDEGMDVTERDRGTFWGLAGDTFREDQFGRVSLNGGPPRKISRGLSP